MYRNLMLALIVSVILVLGGCAATKTAIEHRNLQTQTKMSATIFLDPVPPEDKTVLVQIKNTSDKEDFKPDAQIKSVLEKAGYMITDNPNEAHYLLQANILKIGTVTGDDMRDALVSGYGGTVEGAVAGAILTQDSSNPLLGGLLGAAVGSVADSLVKKVTYTIVTDIQVSEKVGGNVKVVESNRAVLNQGTSGSKFIASNEQTDWRRYQTRIVSTADKVNLEFDEARPELLAGLTRSISGIFG